MFAQNSSLGLLESTAINWVTIWSDPQNSKAKQNVVLVLEGHIEAVDKGSGEGRCSLHLFTR